MLFTSKDGHTVDLQKLIGAGRNSLQDESGVHNSHQYSIIPQLWLKLSVTPSHHKTHGSKRKRLKTETRLNGIAGLVLWGAEPIVFVCCVHPAGQSVCSLPGVEKGLAVSSQPWPAGLSCPQGAQAKGAWARLHLQVVNLTSYCTDTSIIVIKGQSNLFIYWFPTGLRQD